MKSKLFLSAVAASLCFLLSFTVQGANLDGMSPSEPEPGNLANQLLSDPITVETQAGMLTIYFTSNLGEVNVLIEQGTETMYDHVINTSMQYRIMLSMPAGTYTITIADTDGNTIIQETAIVP